jgi:hypothetical protein
MEAQRESATESTETQRIRQGILLLSTSSMVGSGWLLERNSFGVTFL